MLKQDARTLSKAETVGLSKCQAHEEDHGGDGDARREVCAYFEEYERSQINCEAPSA